MLESIFYGSEVYIVALLSTDSGPEMELANSGVFGFGIRTRRCYELKSQLVDLV